MKQLLLKSLVVAVVFGLAIGFFDSLVWIRNIHKYDPPINTAEAQELARLPVVEMQARMRQREVHLTRIEWLADAIRYPYFWRGVAEKSLVPAFGIFFACVCLGRWSRGSQLGLPNKKV